MKSIYPLLLTLFLISCTTKINTVESTETAKANIKNVLDKQEIAWNNHDLEGFMQGYWKSDALKFYGSNGLTKGWDSTLANYKKRLSYKS